MYCYKGVFGARANMGYRIEASTKNSGSSWWVGPSFNVNLLMDFVSKPTAEQVPSYDPSSNSTINSPLTSVSVIMFPGRRIIVV